jgi:hypothetical protein
VFGSLLTWLASQLDVPLIQAAQNVGPVCERQLKSAARGGVARPVKNAAHNCAAMSVGESRRSRDFPQASPDALLAIDIHSL